MVKKRNKYTAEFKQEAVGLVMEHGYSYADAGRSLGVIFPRFHGHIVKHSFSIHTASGSDYQ